MDLTVAIYYPNKVTSFKFESFMKVSITCFSLVKKFTTIIPEIIFFFVSPLVGQMYENSHFDFKDLRFLIQ